MRGSTLQFGDYYRIINGEDSDYVRGLYQWMCVSADQSTALGLMLQGQVIPNMFYAKFKTKGLAQDKCYHFYNRKLSFNIKEFGDLINTVSPIHIKKDSFVHNMVAKFKRMEGETEEYTVEGSLLNHAGVKLKQGFCGMGYDNEVRLFQDYYSRLYVMEEVPLRDSFNNSL